MATTKTDAQRVTELRKQAMDKSLPQEVRDMADTKANEIERKAAGAAGVRLAKGGMPMVEKAGKKVPEFAADGVGKMAKGGVAKKAAPKKMMYGGDVKPMMAKGGAVKKDAPKKMMMGGAVVAKAPAKELPMRGQRTSTNMAKGGMTKKAKK